MSMYVKSARTAETPTSAEPPEDMSELTVLVSGDQAVALEEAAHENGLTVGQFLRKLIRQALRQRCFHG